MMIPANECLILNSSLSIRETMKQMSLHQNQYALLVNNSEELVGIVTDGDLRRAISLSANIDDTVSIIMNKNPKTINEKNFNHDSYKLLNDKIRYIPIINKNSYIVGVINRDETNFSFDIDKHSICVIGLGYVGLTLSLIMAESGFKVYGYDKNKKVINLLKNHKSTFFENGIDTYIKRYVNKELSVTNNLKEINADVFVISVGTPLKNKSNIPDIRYIEDVVDELSKKLKKNNLIIMRSTVPIGTTRNIVKNKIEKFTGLSCGKDFYLAFAPERTIEGDALNEIKMLPQIVGGFDKRSLNLADQVFSEFAKNIIKVDSLEGAEMIKIMNNTFRDVKFGYANEMALICKDLGLDMNTLVAAANNGYSRDKIPIPSPGVGGPCLPKDAKILSYSIKNRKRSASLIRSARKINESIVNEICFEVKTHFKSIKKGKNNVKLFIAGMAFKGNPETSDMRGSNSIDLINTLIKNGISMKNIFVFDPIISNSELKKLGYNYSSCENGFKDADAVFLMNNHDSFNNLDIYNLLKKSSKNCIFFDGWHFFEPSKIKMINNIRYMSVGYLA